MSWRLGVDIDGVLAEQVEPVLARLRQRHGVAMARADVKTWDEPVRHGTFASDMKVEIESALEDPAFVRTLQPLPGAPETVRALRDKGFAIVILTNRSPAVRDATEEWLKAHRIPYDEFYNTKERGKEAFGSDLLIDDYPGHLLRYVRGGHRILFRQPWNARFAATEAAGLGIQVVDTWEEVPGTIAKRFPVP